MAHGAIRKSFARPNCDRAVKVAGYCSAHGPSRRICDEVGCDRVAVQGVRCKRHGARLRRLCNYPCGDGTGRCGKNAIVGGTCTKHHNRVADARGFQRAQMQLGNCASLLRQEDQQHRPQQRQLQQQTHSRCDHGNWQMQRQMRVMHGQRGIGACLELYQPNGETDTQLPQALPPNNHKRFDFEEVRQRLRSYFPQLAEEDVDYYLDFLTDDGFDSLDTLGELMEDDITFMKKAHKCVNGDGSRGGNGSVLLLPYLSGNYKEVRVFFSFMSLAYLKYIAFSSLRNNRPSLG